jgi:hypothetical protein
VKINRGILIDQHHRQHSNQGSFVIEHQKSPEGKMRTKNDLLVVNFNHSANLLTYRLEPV